MSKVLEAPRRDGYDALWEWFSLSYASFLTMPRVLMHEMPDDWQARMAELCREWNAHWDWPDDFPSPKVMAHDGRWFTSWPDWLLNYRRPEFNRKTLDDMKAK